MSRRKSAKAIKTVDFRVSERDCYYPLNTLKWWPRLKPGCYRMTMTAQRLRGKRC